MIIEFFFFFFFFKQAAFNASSNEIQMATFLTYFFVHCLFFSVVHFPFVFDFVFASIPELFACFSHAVLRQIFATLLGTFPAISFSVLEFFSIAFLEPSVSPLKAVPR